MNVLPILFLSLIAVVYSRFVPSTSYDDRCEKAGPEVYCASKKLSIQCDAEDFCEKYLKKHPCEKGPEVYCKTKELALSCKKDEYCLTWPADDVVAVKLIDGQVTTRRPTYIFYNGIG